MKENTDIGGQGITPHNTKSVGEMGKVGQKVAGILQKSTIEYQGLANVRACRDGLLALLKSENNNFVITAKVLIYEMLTRRSEFVQETKYIGKSLGTIIQDQKPQAQWYQATREALKKLITSNSQKFAYDTNPEWFSIDTRPEVNGSGKGNMKVYTTLPITEYTFIQHIYNLAGNLRQLALETDDCIKVKFPQSLIGFIAHNDSIVVHFKKTKNTARILQILDSWLQSNNLSESPREMGRIKVTTDSKDASFSQIISENIAHWIDEHREKYEDSILVDEAIHHAITQSQRSPIG